MKFSKTLQGLSEVDDIYGPLYIQYKVLKKFLRQMQNGEGDQATFVQMVENEHQRVCQIVECKLSELQLMCSSLVTNLRFNCQAEKIEDERRAALARLSQHAGDMGSQLAGLERFVHYNKEGFRKIMKKHDKLLPYPLSWLEMQRLRTVFVRFIGDLERLLVELSDIYRVIKENTEGEQSGEHKVSNDTFERKSFKYWVAEEDVFELKTRLVKHLPLHIFDRKSAKGILDKPQTMADILLQPTNNTDTTVNYDRLGWISSVYFDNDSLKCYRTRMDGVEGATLLRVRWYADPKDMRRTDNMYLPRAPRRGLFFERKTHHESWVCASSLKERFPINSDQVQDFIQGDLAPSEFLEDERSLGLAKEIQDEIQKRQLHPVIRTVYQRAAFQHDDTNDVRITLDMDLSFVDEGSASQSGDSALWKRDEKDVEGKSDWTRFPYAVLEVKLKAGEPQWLQDILKAPYIRKVQKFSKFQQACSTFYPDNVHAFPYWYTKEDIADVKAKHSVAAKSQQTTARESTVSDVSSNMTFSNAAYRDDEVPGQDIQVVVTTPIHSETVKTFRDPSYTITGKETAQTTTAVAVCTANGKNQSYGGIPGKQVNKEKTAKPATQRAKIEPKTFFANERTLLQWYRTGLNLFSLGGLLYGLGTDKSSTISGMVFMFLSTCIIIYALCMFYWRMYMIKYRRQHRYDDWFGPGMLAVIFLAAIGTTLAMHYLYYEPDTTDPATDGMPGNTPKFNVTEPIEIKGLPAFYTAVGLSRDVLEKDNYWTCSDGLITHLDGQNGEVVSSRPVNGGGHVNCAAITSVSKLPSTLALLSSTDLHFVQASSGVINSTFSLEFLTGDVTGITHITSSLRDFPDMTPVVEGTFFVTSLPNKLHAFQLLQNPQGDSFVHGFSIPLDQTYTRIGRLAAHDGYIFVLVHSDYDLNVSQKLLVYDVMNNVKVCNKEFPRLGDIAGFDVMHTQGYPINESYPLLILENSVRHSLVKVYADVRNCYSK